MSIADWIDEREMSGYTTFSVEDVVKALPDASLKNISSSLWRLTEKHRIALVQKAFYVIVPPVNRRDGIVSPFYYINNLMRKIGRDYYVGLLTAASLHGATHQAVMTCDVMLPYPHISFSGHRNNQLSWHYRASIPMEFVERRKTDTGYMNVSSPELTALDLVRHSKESGGLSHVATVLAELSEKLDFRKSDGKALLTASGATVQRLGYILERTIGNSEVVEVLYDYWRKLFPQSRSIPLIRDGVLDKVERNDRWKVLVNANFEVDDL